MGEHGASSDDSGGGRENPSGGKAGESPSSKGSQQQLPPENDVSASAAHKSRSTGSRATESPARPSTQPTPSAGARSRGPRRVAARTSQTPDRALQDLWVARLRDGDAEALRDVVHAFGERLTAVVSGILRDRDAVDDVVQETFTKAFYRIASFKGGSSLYTWLYRIAVNAAISHRRKHQRIRMQQLPEETRGDEPGGGQALRLRELSTASEPSDAISREELRQAVARALAALDEEHRVVLVLRDIESQDYQAIAEILDLPLGTVRSRLHRAREAMKELLAPVQEKAG